MKTVVIVIVALLIAGFAYIYWQNSQVPELGHEAGQLKPLSDNPNGVSTQSTDPAKSVVPLPFKEDQASTMRAIREAVAAYGGAEIMREEADYLRVVFVTEKMRFRDDAEFYLDAETKQVHFRSASRAGKSDMGLNGKRYERLTELYNR